MTDMSSDGFQGHGSWDYELLYGSLQINKLLWK